MAGTPGWSRARRPAARDRTRQAILDTALRLFAERGYVGVRVEDIAREAGVSRATFYKHFAERDEILAELYGRLLGAAGEPTAPPPGDAGSQVRRLLDEAASAMLADELLARFLYSLPIRHDAVLPGGAAVLPVFGQVRAVLDEADAAGQLRPGVSVERAVEMLGRSFEAAMRDWAERRVDDPRRRLAELLDLAFGGLQGRGRASTDQ